MKRPKELEAWGRSKARQRYAAGGDVLPAQQEELLPTQSADRNAEIDNFISAVMRDQIKKMNDGE